MIHRIKTTIRAVLFSMLFLGSSLANADQITEIIFNGIQGELLANVEKNVRLQQRLANDNEISTDEILQLKRTLNNEVKQALHPFGYYLAEVFVDQESGPESLVYRVELNEPVRINSIILDLQTSDPEQKAFEDWRQNFGLQKNDVLNQVSYENDKKALLATALGLGYFDANFTTQSIVINESRTSADIQLSFSSGDRHLIDKININWEGADDNEWQLEHPINDDILDPLISIKPGDFYTVEQITTTRRNLLASPYFSNVVIQAVHDEAKNSTVPINIDLVAKKKHAYSAEVGVGTDTGVRGGVGYQNRRVNTLGHTMGFRLGGSKIKRSAILNYQIPYRRSAQDNINIFATIEDENGEVRQFTATKVGSELLLHWRNSILRFGLTASTEEFNGEQYNDPQLDEPQSDQTTELLIPSIQFENSTTEDIFFPQRGRSFTALLRATSESLASDLDLAQAILEGKQLFPLGSGRLRLRLKLAGSLIGESSDVPDSLGFLAGGDDSIRGYKFESIGVKNGDIVSVGENLIVGSIEYEHLIKSNISAAAFFDAGDVFNTKPSFKRGAGIGLRWNLLFGAMRFDVASALDKEGNPLRIHFSVGTDL